jgi:two-component system response regulator NreC
VAGGSKTRVIVVSMYGDEVTVRGALRAGAKGYLLKDSFKEEFYFAITSVARGEAYLCARLAGLVLNDLTLGAVANNSQDPFGQLSSREREVFQLILEGQSNRQMASTMKISIKTVDKHRTNLMRKLNVHDITALMHIAMQHGILFVR